MTFWDHLQVDVKLTVTCSKINGVKNLIWNRKEVKLFSIIESVYVPNPTLKFFQVGSNSLKLDSWKARILLKNIHFEI